MYFSFIAPTVKDNQLGSLMSLQKFFLSTCSTLGDQYYCACREEMANFRMIWLLIALKAILINLALRKGLSVITLVRLDNLFFC